MSRDYFVVWTRDFPTPSALGLGEGLLAWPSPNAPWPQSAAERAELGYPAESPRSLDWVFVHSSTTPRDVPEVVKEALGARRVARSFTVQNDDAFACCLAEAGEGACWDEEEMLLYPDVDGPSGRAPSEGARRELLASIWTSMHGRKASPCKPFVEAAARGDLLAAAVLRKWAPQVTPNLGVRNMGHDRELCEAAFEAAMTRPAGLAALIRLLVAHNYYPAGRRPEFAALAREADVDVGLFLERAARDGRERMKWFNVVEPLD